MDSTVAAASAAADASVSQTAAAPAPRTRIKMCGLSRAADVRLAAELGVDAVGLVFWEKSARSVKPAEAAELARAVSPYMALVGLFVNADIDTVRRAASTVPLSMLQFHGDETPERCRELASAVRLPWMRALRVGATTTSADLLESALAYADGNGIILDAIVDGYGGGGKVFDWSLIPEKLGRRAVLSGGLNAQNVAEAIRTVRPYAVDVSSGIEVPGARGVKDAARMIAFVRAVRGANAD
ncbi:MAG: phosphoribosylanthranilate isomerase [Janthinobacterium lividum]